jgi:hypothetical protein
MTKRSRLRFIAPKEWHDMIDIIDVLEEYGPLAHETIIPARGGRGADLATPPMVFWTFAAPAKERAAVLRDAVVTCQGAFAWELTVDESNKDRTRWALMPARVRQYANLNDHPVMLAAQALGMSDPNFGQRANSELPHVAVHLRNALLRATGGRSLEQASR